MDLGDPAPPNPRDLLQPQTEPQASSQTRKFWLCEVSADLGVTGQRKRTRDYGCSSAQRPVLGQGEGKDAGGRWSWAGAAVPRLWSLYPVVHENMDAEKNIYIHMHKELGISRLNA